MKKVGQPPIELFEKARQWHESRSRTKEFAAAVQSAAELTGSMPTSDRTKILRALEGTVTGYETSATKLQNVLSTKLKEHFFKKGIVENSVIRLSYPVYNEEASGKHLRFVTAVIKVVAFNYQPADTNNQEARFRVIGKVATGVGEFSDEMRYFPLDKNCSFEAIA